MCMSGRGQSATWFEDDHGALLVDCGPSFMLNAQRFGVDFVRLTTVAITHFHGDHLAGLPYLLMFCGGILKRTAPLRILGPAGLKERLKQMCELAYEHWKLPFELLFHEWDPGGERVPWTDGVWHITPVPMKHKPESLGFRLDTGRCVVAFSGDTLVCPALFELAKGADVLVVECTLPSELNPPVHIHARELEKILPDLGAARVAAIHTDDVTAALLDPLPEGLFFPVDGEIRDL